MSSKVEKHGAGATKSEGWELFPTLDPDEGAGYKLCGKHFS